MFYSLLDHQIEQFYKDENNINMHYLSIHGIASSIKCVVTPCWIISAKVKNLKNA
jgi:hypothetical protein